MYATHFYISYSFLYILLISQYATHFSINVYCIIVSYTILTPGLTGNLTQDPTGNLAGDLAWNLTQDLTGDFAGNLTGDLLLWVNLAGCLAPDPTTEPCVEPYNGTLQRNFAWNLTTELCMGLASSLSN